MSMQSQSIFYFLGFIYVLNWINNEDNMYLQEYNVPK